MADEHITPGPPQQPNLSALSGPPTGPTRPTPRPSRWLQRVLLLLAFTLVGALVTGLLTALEAETAALVVFVVFGVLTLATVASPLVAQRPRRPGMAFALFGIALVMFLGAWAVTGILFFKAYVMPTGGMAQTLPGFHRKALCPQCGHTVLVNASAEFDPDRDARERVTGCVCEGCHDTIDFDRDKIEALPQDPVRILVARYLLQKQQPERHRAIVFRYPRAVPNTPERVYVQRVVGLPEETLALFGGDVYRHAGVVPEDAAAEELFRQGKFEIVRKPPDLMLALRCLVHDNDHQPADLGGILPPRWVPGPGWEADGKQAFRARGGDETAWLRYRHVLRPDDWPQRDAPDRAAILAAIQKRPHPPRLILDFVSFNSAALNGADPRGPERLDWVGDLMLECEVTIEKADGEVLLELSRGEDRFRARVAPASGICTLSRLDRGGKLQELGAQPTAMRGPGNYRLRFANFDRRLTLWVNEALPFGDGVEYAAPTPGPTANDLQPAAVGSKGAGVQVRRLKLWRDVYYPQAAVEPDHQSLQEIDWADPQAWGRLRDLKPKFFRVAAGHYFVLGDNSRMSSDSRDWGLVPQDHLLGRVLLIYHPSDQRGQVR